MGYLIRHRVFEFGEFDMFEFGELGMGESEIGDLGGKSGIGQSGILNWSIGN